jgi:hypothetical protein
MRRKAQRGSETIEFGLILLPLCAFMLLLFDMAWAIYVRSTIQYAVREGTRFAVTSRVFPGMGHDASIKKVVQNFSLGMLKGERAALIKIRYYEPATLAETSANRAGNLVEISVEGYELVPAGAVMRSALPFTMTARSADRMEGQPGGLAPDR